jgi:hypothetical protein
VLNARTNAVLDVANKEVSEAVCATKVAVPPLNVYKPTRARVNPEEAVPDEDTRTSLTSRLQRGVKNVKYATPLAMVPLKLPIRG